MLRLDEYDKNPNEPKDVREVVRGMKDILEEMLDDPDWKALREHP